MEDLVHFTTRPSVCVCVWRIVAPGLVYILKHAAAGVSDYFTLRTMTTQEESFTFWIQYCKIVVKRVSFTPLQTESQAAIM